MLEKIDLLKIDGFKNHPYKVNDDESLKELASSIKENGLLNPLIVRLKSNGRYELISGHRRKKAMESIGISEAEVYVKKLSDEEATIEMVDSNMYREKVLPSEKAFAYKMKLEALKHQGKSLSPKGTKSHSVDEIDDTKTQIYRYVRLTYLIPEFHCFIPGLLFPETWHPSISLFHTGITFPGNMSSQYFIVSF